jgi:hypothetical protein
MAKESSVTACDRCGRETSISNLDAKPDFARMGWGWRIFAWLSPLGALASAADRGVPFDRLECSVCYGAGFVASAVDEAPTPAPPIGFEYGDVCGRDGCTGVLETKRVRDCYCHISPPCSACVEAPLVCEECGWGERDDDDG